MKCVRVLVMLTAMSVLPAMAASTGTLGLSGVIALVNTITVTPLAKASALNILAGDPVGTAVAKVDETSNNIAGYQVKMYSANGGKLKHATDATRMTSYRISYAGGTAIIPPTMAAPVAVKTVTTLSALTTASSNVTIAVDAYPTAMAGTYSDTITFSIVAN